MLPIDLLLNFNPKHVIPVPVESMLKAMGIDISRRDYLTYYFEYYGVYKCPVIDYEDKNSRYYDRYMLLKTYAESIKGGPPCPVPAFISDMIIPPLYLNYYLSEKTTDVNELAKIFDVSVSAMDQKLITINKSGHIKKIVSY